ncbi:MAG: phosphoesterase [Herbinix sp.]|jgi:undecaprenyl-diphosphatase|nr:phosphoesterase [Herbinix sp.]
MLNFIQNIDQSILFYIQEHLKNPALDRVMVFVTTLGNAGFLWIVLALILLTRKKYQRCGMVLLLSLLLAKFIGDDVLKPLFGRLRPCNQFPEIPLLIKRIHSYSFPSGHTMQAFTAATVCFYYIRPLGIVVYGMASMMAYSRMYLFVHYPSDILGGIICGIFTAFFTINFIKAICDYCKLPVK